MKSSWSKGVGAIRELCALRLPAQTLVPAVLEALHQVVPSSRNLFDWTDETGRLVHYYFEGPIDITIAQLYFDEFHNRREAEAMPRFDALARRPTGIHSAADLDHAGFFGSALYNEIWRPQDLKYRVEAVLRGHAGRLVGSLVLYRGQGDRCFTSEEERRLAHVVPLLSAGLAGQCTAIPNERHVPVAEPAETLLMNLDGTVLHGSRGVERTLMLASGGISSATLSQPLDWLARSVLAPLLQRLRVLARVDGVYRHSVCTGQLPMELNFANAWGQFRACAQLLMPRADSQQPLVQARIVRCEPYRVALARTLQGLPLTAGQVRVCSALLQGQTQAQIAVKLGVAPATVIDHVRKTYRTLEVRSVLELRALVDGKMG